MKNNIYVNLDRTKQIIENIQRKIIQEYNSTQKDKINKAAITIINQLNQLNSNQNGFIELKSVYKIINKNDLDNKFINKLFAQNINNKINCANNSKENY